MATADQVLSMLIPNGGWAIQGNQYEDIEFLEAEPITKKQFQDGFAQFDAWKTEQEAQAKDKKAAAEAKLTALGLTADDLRALGL